MSRLTLLPCIFAVPDISDGREEFERYLKTLLDWKAAWREKWVKISLPDKTVDLLAESNAYPVYPHIAKACEVFGIFEYSVNDCIQIVETFLHRCESFEAESAIKDASWTNITVEPDITELQKETFRNEVKRIIVILGIIFQHCNIDKIPHILACAKLPSGNRTLVMVNAHIDIMEPDQIGTLRPPFDISRDVPACTDFLSFLMSLDANAVWQAAEDSLATDLAIRLAWYQESVRLGQSPVWKEPIDFRIGREFITSVDNCNFRHDLTKVKMLIYTIVDILLRRNLQNAHALRIDEGGASSQRLRGKDKAKRWDIDREWHLHFWDTESGVPEFATIVPHNSFYIPEN